MSNFFYMSFLWSIFFCLILIIFILDSYILKKKKIKKKSLENYFFYNFSWFFLSLFFVLIFWLLTFKYEGSQIANSKTILFCTGYLLELSLSIDNVLMWVLIFEYLKIPKNLQKKVLSYGVWSAVILRSIIIFYGKIFFLKWHWLFYCFGFFFVFTSLKFIFFSRKTGIKDNNIKTFWMSNVFRVSNNVNNENFFLIINKKFYITPLFFSLIIIELSDIIFSIDSIPAIFSITNNFFIIFSSNIFSVLGLRSMYSFVCIMIKKNNFIKYGLSVILMFIGLKMIFENFFIISTSMTLLIILTIIIMTFIINNI